MKRRMGFTLVEAVVVVAALGMLGASLSASVGGCSPWRRALTHPPDCRANLTRIGKALAVYAAVNGDQYPWMVSDNKWDAPTGVSQTIAPSTSTTYNVSALLFMLVRDNQAPGLFVCPSTTDTRDPNTKTDADFNWDFSPFRAGGAEHVSYSYQAPIRDANGVWGSGVTANSDSGLVILADRTPTYDGKTATFNWASPGKADPRTGMSQNHKGKIINLLYADLHVGESARADAGIRKDNVYSCADGRETEQGPGVLDISKHNSPMDSFLLGPKKMP